MKENYIFMFHKSGGTWKDYILEAGETQIRKLYKIAYSPKRLYDTVVLLL